MGTHVGGRRRKAGQAGEGEKGDYRSWRPWNRVASARACHRPPFCRAPIDVRFLSCVRVGSAEQRTVGRMARRKRPKGGEGGGIREGSKECCAVARRRPRTLTTARPTTFASMCDSPLCLLDQHSLDAATSSCRDASSPWRSPSRCSNSFLGSRLTYRPTSSTRNRRSTGAGGARPPGIVMIAVACVRSRVRISSLKANQSPPADRSSLTCSLSPLLAHLSPMVPSLVHLPPLSSTSPLSLHHGTLSSQRGLVHVGETPIVGTDQASSGSTGNAYRARDAKASLLLQWPS